MSSTAIVTVTKMLESLPEPLQEQAVQHLREYLADLLDEMEWQARCDRTQRQIIEAARRAKAEIAEGRAEPLDYNRL